MFQDKKRLCEAHERGEDFLVVAQVLGINRSTAYNIVRRGLAPRERGGAHNRILDNEIIECGVELLEQNPLMTLKELNVKIHATLNKPPFSDQSLAKWLDGQIITLKLARDVPAQRNSPEVIDERFQYAHWLMSPDVVNETKFFIDEFGVNIFTRRSQGRSARGDRVYRKIAGQKGPNITVCIAVSPTLGLAHYSVAAGGQTRDRFISFLQVLCGNFLIENGMNASGVCVFDNAKPHANLENMDIPGLLAIKQLPRYSPFLNMAENAISSWKSAYKSQIAEQMSIFINPSDTVRAGRSLHQYRIDKVSEIVCSTSSVITQQKCFEWYNHSLTRLPECLSRAHIDG